MKINLKLISLILIVFFISLSMVSAENATQTDVNDNTENTDGNINEITTNDNPTTEQKVFIDLQQQIWKSESGDTIELDSDYIYNNHERVGITIDRTLTIDGKGHTLDGNNSAIFYIKGIPNVELKNIKFINGVKNCGGATFADSGSNYLTITNCTFINNKATTANVGGALYIKGSHCTIVDCHFENNYAPSSGGAVRIEGDSNTLSNNYFTGNTAESSLGGAICALGHNNKITDSIFTKNLAGRDGGAICMEGTKVEDIGTKNIISNNVFDSNKASGSKEGSHGGAISMAGESCEISNNNFTNNHADDIGGAIRWNGAKSAMGKIITNQFKSNDAKSGGAIYIAGHGISITKNTFENNKATAYAGGTINIKGNTATISDNEITKSSAKSSGGAIYIDGKSAKILNNNINSSSAADNGGALYLTGASATITGNKFIGNTAEKIAGAAQIKSISAKIKNNEFTDNVAKFSGGAAYIEGAKITLQNNVFTKNKAGAINIGGAIRFSGNDAVITKNKFIGNTANVGFAYYGSGENPKITSNTFSPKKTNTERWEKTKVKLTTPTKTFKKSAKTKKVTITLKSANKRALNKKKITLTVNKKKYTGTTNSKGQVTFKVKLTKKGIFKYTVKFAGAKYYDSLSKKGTIKIK